MRNGVILQKNLEYIIVTCWYQIHSYSISKQYFITVLDFVIKIYEKIYHTWLNIFIITISITYRDLEENIEKLTNKMTAEFNKVFIENYISNLVMNEFYSVQSVKLEIPNNLFDEITKKVRKII